MLTYLMGLWKGDLPFIPQYNFNIWIGLSMHPSFKKKLLFYLFFWNCVPKGIRYADLILTSASQWFWLVLLGNLDRLSCGRLPTARTFFFGKSYVKIKTALDQKLPLCVFKAVFTINEAPFKKNCVPARVFFFYPVVGNHTRLAKYYTKNESITLAKEVQEALIWQKKIFF